MSMSKDELQSLFTTAEANLFRDNVFGKGRSFLTQGTFNNKLLGKAINSIKSPDEGKANWAQMVLIAYIEHKAIQYYSQYKQEHAYLTEFKSITRNDKDSFEAFILQFIKDKGGNYLILQEAVRGYLLTSATSTKEYSQSRASKEVDELLQPSERLFDVKPIEKEKFAAEGPIVDVKPISQPVYSGDKAYKGTIFGEKTTTTSTSAKEILVDDDDSQLTSKVK